MLVALAAVLKEGERRTAHRQDASGPTCASAQGPGQRDSGTPPAEDSRRAALRRTYKAAMRVWHPDKAAGLLAALPSVERGAARERLLALAKELSRQHEAEGWRWDGGGA
jgi:hypothetical protein